MKYNFITSFSDAQFDLYARDMLDSFFDHTVGLDDVHMEAVYPDQLRPDVDLQRFLAVYGDRDFAHGRRGNGTVDYRMQAIRFCYKVFAYTNPIYRSGLGQDDWLIWLDADTKVTGKIIASWLEEVCPDGKMGSYIGRKDWDHSECGWVAVNMNAGGHDFLDRMRWMYVSGMIFGLPQWHDSYVFDVVRRADELEHGEKWHNLAKGIPGNHPWPHTLLGQCIEHFKGPEAKKERFGEVA